MKDLLVMRQLDCTWQELQELPSEYLEVWKAVWRGEDQGRRSVASRTK